MTPADQGIEAAKQDARLDAYRSAGGVGQPGRAQPEKQETTMKKLLCLLPVAALAAALLFTPAPACAAGCGMKPMKPMKPMGCRDLVLQCQCDSRGQNCQWTWVCVK